MNGIDAQRSLDHVARDLRSVMRVLQDGSDGSPDVNALVAGQAAAGRGRQGGKLHCAAAGWGASVRRPVASEPSLVPILTATATQTPMPVSDGFLRAAARRGHRLPWLLAALGLHALLFALLLLPSRAPAPVPPPVPLETEIITEPQVPPAPPPPIPVTLVQPPEAIVVPAPLVSIPDPVSIAAASEPARDAVAAKVVRAAPAAAPKPISPPHFDAAYLHNPAPQYPLESRRLREQGSVLLRVEVSGEGSTLQVLIEHTSGWPLLDRAAISAVKRWRFVPARSGNDPVDAWVLVPIEFDLRS